MRIIKAGKEDADALIGLVLSLAQYEHLAPPNDEAVERLRRDLNVKYESFLALEGSNAVGYAMFYYTYSSFLARPTLYLEDIFVLEEHRKEGIGKALFDSCVMEAKEKECGRMDFVVLDWNSSAQRFYERAGAKSMKEWILYRLSL
jgi:ribosomal protein S18 acetylase RimI-like enzyme